jgi:hypothetical protein
MAVALSNWFLNNPSFLALILLSFFIVDTGILFFLRSHAPTGSLGRLWCCRFWCLCMSLLPVTMVLIAVIAAILPALTNQMQK